MNFPRSIWWLPAWWAVTINIAMYLPDPPLLMPPLVTAPPQNHKSPTTAPKHYPADDPLGFRANIEVA